MNHTALSAVAIALYLASGVLFGIRLARGPDALPVPSKNAIIALGLTAVLAHTVVLYGGIFVATGLNLGLFNAASLMFWLVALLLLLSALRMPVENLGVVLLPLAALMIVLDLLYPPQQATIEPASWGLSAHILISILAFSLLSIAAVQAVLLAVQDNHLRNRHPGGFIRALPPLQSMETLLFHMIAVGFVFLSASLLSGFAFLEDMFAQHLSHKTVLSLVGWAVFAILLWGRWRFGWRGRTAIRWTLGGFLTLMLAYFGSKAVLELVLERT